MGTAFLTGFETGDTSDANATSGTISVQSTITRGSWSGYALRANPTTSGTGIFRIAGFDTTGASNNTLLNVSTAYIRLYLYVNTFPASNNEPFLQVNSGAKFYLFLNSSKKISATDGNFNAIATGTAVLASQTWYRIEVKVGSGNGASVEWRINGSTDVSTTANLSSTGLQNISIGKVANRNSQSVDLYFDDLLVTSTGYPGAGQCTCLLPDANGNYQTWSIGAGSGSHYQQVNERPPDGNTTYLVSPLASPDAETEALTSAESAGINGTINSVFGIAIVARNGSANANCRMRFRSGTTDTDTTANFNAPPTYTLLGNIFDADPNTGSAWATSGIDGINTGAVCESAANQTRMTWTGAMVDYHPLTLGSAGLQAVSTVLATATVVHQAKANLQAASTVLATATVVHQANGSLQAVSTVLAIATVVHQAKGSLQAVSTLLANATVVHQELGEKWLVLKSHVWPVLKPYRWPVIKRNRWPIYK